MRRKYADCQREDGDCTACSLVNCGRDCHNRAISKLEWSRRMAEMTQANLAEKSGVTQSQVSKILAGKAVLTITEASRLAAALGKDFAEIVRQAEGG